MPGTLFTAIPSGLPVHRGPPHPVAMGTLSREMIRRSARPEYHSGAIVRAPKGERNGGKPFRAHCSSSEPMSFVMDSDSTFAAVIRDPGATKKPC